MGTLPAASVIPREPHPAALALNPAGSPLEARCCLPRSPGAGEAACLLRAQAAPAGRVSFALFGLAI